MGGAEAVSEWMRWARSQFDMFPGVATWHVQPEGVGVRAEFLGGLERDALHSHGQREDRQQLFQSGVADAGYCGAGVPGGLGHRGYPRRPRPAPVEADQTGRSAPSARASCAARISAPRWLAV